MLIARLACAIACALILPAVAAAQTERVATIQQRGHLNCAVWPEVRGFSFPDASGTFQGLDVDMCRAVATAILGSPDRTRFVRMRTMQEFFAAPDIDLVSRRLTWSLTREGRLGLRFGPVMFYDGQTFLAPRRLGLTRVDQLGGRRICVDPRTPAEFNLGPLFRHRKLALEQVLIEPGIDLAEAFRTGRCEVYTSDQSMLASIRAGLRAPHTYVIFGELVSKEPLAQVVRQGDERLFDILRWTIFALINAEEFGITAANAERMRESGDPEIRRLLGSDDGNGLALGLRETWAYDVISALGNYGGLYERHVGMRTPVGLPRGLNRLWTTGGLLWAPPAR